MTNLIDTLNIRPADNVVCDGNLIEVFRGEGEFKKIGGLKQIVFHTLTSKKVGGNHYHKEKFEIIYVIEGIIDVYLRDPIQVLKLGKKKIEGEKPGVITYKQRVFQGQKFNLVPGIAHALHSQGKSKIMEFTNLTFNPENQKNDVYDCEVFNKQLFPTRF